MCGRYTNRLTWEEIVRRYRITEPSIRPQSNFQPRYNIAPTQNGLVVRVRNDARELADLRWALVAKDSKGGARMINAQSETWGTKPAFREAFRSRRCLVVADGFYEWPEKNKPRLITLKDNEPFAFAGVWERWQPNGGEKLETYSILTCPPNEFMADIHNRMPVILAADAWSDWLGETKARDTQLQSLCAPFPPERMTAWLVSARVGNVKNDDAQLV